MSDSHPVDADAPTPPPPGNPTPATNPPLWVTIVGACFLGLAVIFFMALIVASLFGFTVPGNSRFLVCVVLALCASIGSGFLGGSAVASGQISVPKWLNNPVRFGVTGGIAALIIVLLLCHNLYGEPSFTAQHPTISDVTAVEGEGRTNVSIRYRLESLPPQHKLWAEVAEDQEFKRPARERFLIDNFTAGEAVLSIPRAQPVKYWARMVVDNPEGQAVAKSDPWSFQVLSQ